MNRSPFVADETIARRIAHLIASVGPEFENRLAGLLVEGYIVPGASVARLIDEFDLLGPRDVMLLALPAATKLAVPPISGFFVGAIGLERETGDLILGGNVEFHGVDLAQTLHGEGFVCLRAFARGTSLTALATGEARPCGHCRQTIAEFAFARDLVLIDLEGHALSMADLYPWPFGPTDLGQPGIVPGAVSLPNLTIADERLPGDIADALVSAGRRAHVPYGRCPAAVVLRLTDGRLVSGTTIENVAFNPTIGPLQAALVELLALGHGYASIGSATLAVTAGGPVQPTTAVRALLAAIAPGAPLIETHWA